MALDVNNNITINWDCDCPDQLPIIRQMLIDIEAQDAYMQSLGKNQIQIFSKTVPSQAAWQTQWIALGNTLPIPTGVECLWFDTTNNTYGAQFYSINGTIYPVEMLRYKGLSTILPFAALPPTANLNFGQALRSGVSGLTHWQLTTDGTGIPAAAIRWTIPAHLVGKNYFVKFYAPIYATTSVALNWTIWAENTNFYNTQFGGAGESGFGTLTVNALAKPMIIEWTVEIPAGGSYPTIDLRVACVSTATTVELYPFDGAANTSDTVDQVEAMGRVSAEFSLKVE